MDTDLAGANAHSPTAEGSAGGDTPPNYVYDSAPTAQCRNGVRTITVDFVTLNGATTSTSTELAAANSLYSTCCIRFVAGATPPQESLATTQAWLGGDTDVNASGVTCATPTAEEKSMYDAATSAHSLSSRMRVFLVQTFSGYGTAAGFSRPPYCSGGYANHVILSNAVSSTTNPLAHEFGHILLNSGAHTTAPNLMAPSGALFSVLRIARRVLAMLRGLDTNQVEWTPAVSVSNRQSIDVCADTHVLSSVAMIAEAAALAGSGSAAVLGCGRCGEIPLRLLNQTFDLVDLIDIDEDALVLVGAQCKQWNEKKNACQFHSADLTGMIAPIERQTGELVENTVDPIDCVEKLGVLLESTAPAF